MTDIDRELRAYASMAQLLTLAKETQKLFEAAGSALPEPLVRLLNIAPSGNDRPPRTTLPRISVSPMESPPRPSEAESSWIWVPIESLRVSELVLGVLRDQTTRVPAPQVVELAKRLRPDIVAGSVMNAGARMDGIHIDRSYEGWKLIDPTMVPLLYQGNAWGPPSVFYETELAAHRRLVILHILRAMPSGLMLVQLVEHVRDSGLCQASVNKDLVKGDLEALLAAKKVRQVSNSRKWELVDQ